MDLATQQKWDKAAPSFDLMSGNGAEKRWLPFKKELYANMNGRVLFLALGTGLDIQAFPKGKTIESIDISPEMLKLAQPRIDNYDGDLNAQVMDVHELDFADNEFDQIFTSCTFCSVPNPVQGLRSLKRVLKTGGELYMFEHTGSKFFPFSLMMNMMTLLSKNYGPDMNRTTVANVEAAGFELREVDNVFLDVVKIIKAIKPE